MTLSGISICPIMTKDPVLNPVYCIKKCACFCVCRDHNGKEYAVDGHDGYCGLIPD
jgi:hypothetical protein